MVHGSWFGISDRAAGGDGSKRVPQELFLMRNWDRPLESRQYVADSQF
jgi:hypothetical protein